MAHLGRERSDEELAEEELGEDVRLGLERESWDWIEYAGRQCELLDVSEKHGLDGARTWLRKLGLRWVETSGVRAESATSTTPRNGSASGQGCDRGPSSCTAGSWRTTSNRVSGVRRSAG